ncbi:histone-lysine N-methyltransferase SUV39H2 isoform X2 [Ambystoma mexicanum]|uniref:histone-lysine N-methyltransferase SUV39H2 isoform X2 n=1 Tax=Ambystoma mexicanum TaxID=8296 RepID=UPI0037E8A682
MAMSQLRHTLDCEGPPAACPPTGRAAAHACYVQCLATHDILQEICRKEKLTCQSIGITAKLQSKYEVEYLCDQMVIEGLDYYFVKWKGWPKSTNTWEPRSNLKCPLMLKRFHDDLNMYISKIKGGCPFITKKNVRTIKPSVVEFLVKKAKQRIALTRWKEELNRKKKQSGKIYVENTVDLEGPPLDFHYINEYKASPGICLNAEVLCGCDCSDCLLDKCCPAAAGVVFAYNEHKRLIIEPGFPIFECNSCCKCGLDCPNRVIQKGPPYSLCIFRTSNGRGWGVKTLQKIQRHSFVMEYVGEFRSHLSWGGTCSLTCYFQHCEDWGTPHTALTGCIRVCVPLELPSLPFLAEVTLLHLLSACAATPLFWLTFLPCFFLD